MQKLLFFGFLVALFFSCNSENNTEEDKIDKVVKKSSVRIFVEDYFYPKDTVVQMYVYENTENASDRYYERVIYKFIDNRDHYFITKYDAKLNPISTMTYWSDDDEIILMKANIMVNKVSYESKIQKNLMFPKNTGKLAQINYDYPANDSIVSVIEINREFARFDTLVDSTNTIPVVVFQDSLRVSLVDIKNQKHQTIPAGLETYYGKEIGKVLEKNEERTYQLILKTNYGTFLNIK